MQVRLTELDATPCLQLGPGIA